MRVEYNTLDEFLADLRSSVARGCEVLDKTVRVRIDRAPEQDEAVTFTVGLWATALLRSGDGMTWLAEYGGIAGRDTPATGNAGSELAEKWRASVVAACDALGLRVANGKIEMY